MYQKLRETGLVQAVYGGYLSHRGTGQFLFYFVTQPSKVEKVKKELFKIINSFKKNGVPEKTVEDAKRKIINSEIFAREEVTHDAESLGYAASVAEDILYDINYTDNISKVTKKDVDRYLKRYFGENNYTEVQLLPDD
ncbi:MAG: insulinase family protein [Persephonella sp.]|nr:insulinase family protein [Persephonella sp.]